jgi:hypothetical protein
MDCISIHPLEGESHGSSEPCKPTSTTIGDGNVTCLTVLMRGTGYPDLALNKKGRQSIKQVVLTKG